jgi:hypothetical protein
MEGAEPMSTLERRIERLEAVTKKKFEFTETDLELLMSCLPPDYAEQFRQALIGRIGKHNKQPTKSCEHAQLENWKPLLKLFPQEIKEKITAKLRERYGLENKS